MKKKYHRLICLCITMALVFSSLSSAMAHSTLNGDIDLDGRITSHDVEMMKEYIVESLDLDGQAFQNADVNGDGIITSTDLAQVNQLAHCSHNNISTVDRKEALLSCKDNGDGTHTREVWVYEFYRCYECGFSYSEKVDRIAYIEPHSYAPGQNRCSLCNAAKPISISPTQVPYSPPAPTAVPYSPLVPYTGQYLVPDSDTRQMTESECWEWTYEALGFIYHEIFARHGYIFRPDGKYAFYFSNQPWYHPIASQNNQDAIRSINSIEWYNIDLIINVRKTIADQSYFNPNGRSVPSHGYSNNPSPQSDSGSSEPIGAGFY